MAPEVMTDADFDEALALVTDAFGDAVHPADRDAERSIVDPARMLVVRDAGEIVGTSGTFALPMTVPGATMDVAGITWVGVRGTHRRRGLLSAMMTRMLHDAHERGEPVAALHASQGAIYHRFGFGVAGWAASVTVPTAAAFARGVSPGDVRRIEPSPDVLDAHDAVLAQTPGLFRRDATWWDYRLHDPRHSRRGATPLRCAVTDGGYALYATQGSFRHGLPDGTVTVRELIAADPDAHARLWRYLLDLDLMARVRARVAVDDPLLTLLAEPRVAGARLYDQLWTRPVSVGAALSGRRYPVPVDVVLEISDALCPWNTGRWRLSADVDGAVCERTHKTADLSLTAADVGAAFLGGAPLRARPMIEHTQGALAAASAAFGPVDHGPFSPITW